jgi:iron complex transport system substrate-binding protein
MKARFRYETSRARRLGYGRWRFGVFAVALIWAPVAVALAAWGQTQTAQPGSSAKARSDPPRVVIDGFGRRVKIPVRVNRIVSLAPNLTETLYALGLGEKLVGDTDYCDVPVEAKLKPHVGGPQNSSVEAIVALRPDLVFATAIDREETVDALAHLGIAVYANDPHTVRETIESIKTIGDLAGAQEEGADLAAKLNARLAALRERLAGAPKVGALFVVGLDPLITVGRNTFVANALRRAGAESVVPTDQNWPQISFEEVVKLQPDYLIFSASYPGEHPVSLEYLRTRPVWKDLRAVRDGHVAIVSDEIDRPDPGLIDAIEQLARDLHPEVFKAKAVAR